jgi:prevent-host-death family protein
MWTATVNIHEAKTHLSKLIERVSKGEVIVISKAGQAVVDLVPHRPSPVTFGGLSGELSYNDEAFDDTDPDIQQMFYGDDSAPAR